MECTERRYASRRISSLNSDLKDDESKLGSDPRNLCLSVFICGSPLNRYG
jgi:hypothetical protein